MRVLCVCVCVCVCACVCVRVVEDVGALYVPPPQVSGADNLFRHSRP